MVGGDHGDAQDLWGRTFGDALINLAIVLAADTACYMLRQSRIDAAGALHHIIARGIERRKIFRDDQDRYDRLKRLEKIIDQTQTVCYAWR